jgi:hypothetical protein
MLCLLRWGSCLGAAGRQVHAFRAGRDLPAPVIAVGQYASGGSTGLRCLEHVGQHAQVAPEHGRGFGKPRGSGTGCVLVGQFLRANKGGAGQVKRESNILDLMVKARDERGVGHGQVLR